jgi:alpha-D-ribose 1-methylphosphonate 5-triphosphate synthase subunit PhnG
VGSVYGFGAIMGEELDRAYHLAIVDCAYNAKLPETLEWEKLLVEEELQIDFKKTCRTLADYEIQGEFRHHGGISCQIQILKS